MYKVVETSETLEAVNKNGRTKYWQVSVLTDSEGHAFLRQEYWQQKSDGTPGQATLSTPKECKPKNVGRANETSPLQQAAAEYSALIKKKQDEGYCLPGEEPSLLPLPMLAKDLLNYKGTFNYNVTLQPKYDGMRVLYDGNRFWSRNGKFLPTGVTEHLHFDTQGRIVDGELLLPAGYTFQQTMSACKKAGPNSALLIYMLFDIVDPTKPLEERLDNLIKVAYGQGNSIKVCPSYYVKDEQAFKAYSAQFIAEGYEGAILRIPGSLYEAGTRSSNLYKYKEFCDSEYKVVDVITGEAREQNAALYICETESGQQFTVRPKGSIEEREQLYLNKEQLIGKLLTVTYQNLSDTGIPRFPVGKGFRTDV